MRVSALNQAPTYDRTHKRSPNWKKEALVKLSESSASFERMHKTPYLNNECKPGKKNKDFEGAQTTLTIHYRYDHLTKQVIVKFCK